MVCILRSQKRRKTEEEPRSSYHLKMIGMVIRQGALIKPSPQIHRRLTNAAGYVPIQAWRLQMKTSPAVLKIRKLIIPWANNYSHRKATSDDNREQPADMNENDKEKGDNESSEDKDEEERRQEKGAAIRQKCHMPPSNTKCFRWGGKRRQLFVTRNYRFQKNCRVFTIN